MNLKDLGQHAVYLGNSLVFGRSLAKDFHHRKDKVLSTLQGWTAHHLSKACKATLIKSIVQAIPTYAMSLFFLPISITSELDGIIKRFWWNSNSNSSSFLALKSWQEICMPKALGGLGSRRFHEFNMTLISKLFWCMAFDDNKLWSSIFKAKYLKGRSFFKHQIPRNCSRVWRGIVARREIIKQNACFFVGNGFDIHPFANPWIPN